MNVVYFGAQIARILINKISTLFLFAGLLLFTVTTQAAAPVMLSEGDYQTNLGYFASMLEVTEDDIDIQSMIVQQRFEPNHSDLLYLPNPTSDYWLRVSLHNPFRTSRDAVISMQHLALNEVQVYQQQSPAATPPRNGVSTSTTLKTAPVAPTIAPNNGSISWLTSRHNHEQRPALLINLPALTTVTYLLKISPDGFQSSSLTVSNVENHYRQQRWQSSRDGLLIGWLLATTAYFLYLSLARNSRFASFAAIHSLASGLFLANISGLLPQWLQLSTASSGLLSTLLVGISLAALFATSRGLGWCGENAERFRSCISWLATLILLLFVIFAIAGLSANSLYVISFTLVCLYGMSVVIAMGDSREQRSRLWLLTGGLISSFSMTLLLLSHCNLISLPEWSYLLSVITPLSLACSLVLVTFELDKGVTRRLETTQRGISVSPEMLSQIGHELRTPINGVLGMNELLSDTPLSENQRDFTETIGHAGREMLHVANEISILAKVQDDHLELDIRSFDLVALLNQTLTHFQLEANRKQIELVVDHSEQLPIRMLGDRNRLHTLLHNIYAHLLAYTEHGEVSTHLSPQMNGKGQLESVSIQVHMHGSFTNRDELRMMVDRLATDSQLRFERGPSWNLMVTRSLLRYMHASIELESINSQDVSLTLYVPLQPEHPDNLQPSSTDDSLIGMSILIVDDNASLRKVIDKQIRRWGIRVDSTHSGKEALAMLRNQAAAGQPYDAAIIDQDMPIMNGMELMQRINDDESIDIKPNVLMLTGLSISSVREQANAVGIYHLLAKPASGERLKRALLDLRYRPNRPSSLSE